MRSVNGARLAVPDWLSEVVPGWLADVVRPKKSPVPWADMVRAVFAIWVPLAAGFITGRSSLVALPAMGALLSVMIDTGGPYRARVRKIGTAAVFGGAAGLVIGSVIHDRGWVAVIALVVVAGVSAIITRLGATGSATGLQLLVYSALGLGPIGALRPWWHTALQFVAGAVWALALITPSWLLAPRAAEQRAVAAVYHSIATFLRAIGTNQITAARGEVTAALNAAYDALLTGRSNASGRNRPDMQLMAVLNVSHQMAEAATALRAEGERPPPWVTDTIDRLADTGAEYQRTMSEPAPVSRRASAWWPAVVGLEEVMDAVTATTVAISRGAPMPAPDSVRRLSAALRGVADAVDAGTVPSSRELPADPELQPVTTGVRSVLAVLTPGES